MKTSNNHLPILLLKKTRSPHRALNAQEPNKTNHLEPSTKTLQLNSSAYSCIKSSLNAELVMSVN